MTKPFTDHPMAPPAWADIVAAAITPGLLVPYVPPNRPLSMGTPASYWIREGYTMRSAHTVPRAAAPTLTHAPQRLQEVVRTLADRLTDGHLCDLGALTAAEVSSIGADGAALVAIHRLEREADLPALLAAWRTALERAPLLLVGASVRACLREADDAGPPADGQFVRQWTFFELHALLNDAGLAPAFGGLMSEIRGADAMSSDALFVILGGQESSR